MKIHWNFTDIFNVIPVNMAYYKSEHTERQLLADCNHNCGNCVGRSNFMGGRALKIAPNETSRCQMCFADPNTHNDPNHMMNIKGGNEKITDLFFKKFETNSN